MFGSTHQQQLDGQRWSALHHSQEKRLKGDEVDESGAGSRYVSPAEEGGNEETKADIGHAKTEK